MTQAKVLGQCRLTTDVERVLFAPVADRVTAPVSNPVAAVWAYNDVPIVVVDLIDEDQAYRVLDLLIEPGCDAEVHEAAFFNITDLLVGIPRVQILVTRLMPVRHLFVIFV